MGHEENVTNPSLTPTMSNVDNDVNTAISFSPASSHHQPDDDDDDDDVYHVLAVYKFVSTKFDDSHLPELKRQMESFLLARSVRGTLLLAPEGINGTISYPRPNTANTIHDEEHSKRNTDPVLEYLQSLLSSGLRFRLSFSNKHVFYRFKIKIKPAILSCHPETPCRPKNPTTKDDATEKEEEKVENTSTTTTTTTTTTSTTSTNTSTTTTGIHNRVCLDPTQQVGTYVKPGSEWNALLQDPDCLVIDARNDYEVRVGTFRNAKNPRTKVFSELIPWMEDQIETYQPKKVAMFCTGGIRCEKASAACLDLVAQHQIPVYHLEGGILAYLDEVPCEQSLFEGSCYVFDQRVAVTHGLRPTPGMTMCHACRAPLLVEEQDGHVDFVHGQQCTYCKGTTSAKQRERYEARERQIKLAKTKGILHIHDPKLLLLVTICMISSLLMNETTAFTLSVPTRTSTLTPRTPSTVTFIDRIIGRSSTTRLFSATTTFHPNLESTDPFQVLGLDPNDPNALDKNTIKRAYKRLAVQYHPDVVCTQSSTDTERKKASDVFAKINAAYETLSGKNGADPRKAGAAGSSSYTNGWTPPHRRQSSSYSTSSSSSSNNDYKSDVRSSNWEDYMPKYDDADYDAGGDSFGAIFSDLLAGAAGAAAGYSSSSSGGGIFTDFVEFLEQNLDGYSNIGGSAAAGGGVGRSNSRSNDADLQLLLQTGSVDEIGEEMDDTDLVVKQLTTKLQNLETDIIDMKANLANAVRFSEKIEWEQQLDEATARQKVVENYLKRARKRLLALQSRYKELIVRGGNDGKAGGRSRGGSGTGDSYASSRSTSSSANETYNSARSRTSESTSTSTNPEDAWKTEGFGSSGRSRGSGRRRSSSSRSTTADASDRAEESQTSRASSSTSASSDNFQRTSSPASSPSTTTSSSSSSSSSSTDYVPPHRRTRTSTQAAQADKQRLRDLKVDDEFEKLKKEMGL